MEPPTIRTAHAPQAPHLAVGLAVRDAASAGAGRPACTAAPDSRGLHRIRALYPYRCPGSAGRGADRVPAARGPASRLSSRLCRIPELSPVQVDGNRPDRAVRLIDPPPGDGSVQLAQPLPDRPDQAQPLLQGSAPTAAHGSAAQYPSLADPGPGLSGFAAGGPEPGPEQWRDPGQGPHPPSGGGEGGIQAGRISAGLPDANRGRLRDDPPTRASLLDA